MELMKAISEESHLYCGADECSEYITIYDRNEIEVSCAKCFTTNCVKCLVSIFLIGILYKLSII